MEGFDLAVAHAGSDSGPESSSLIPNCPKWARFTRTKECLVTQAICSPL